MRILIATKNPGKIEGAREAFSKYFDSVTIEGFTVPSNVGEQPVNEEIYVGAKNRANNLMQYAKDNTIEGDYFLGIESGMTNLLGRWVIVSIAVVIDKNGYESFGTSPAFPIPNKYVEPIMNTDLGQVMDSLFKEHGLGQQKGGISYLTHNEISRIDLTKEAFMMALTPFINEQIWKD